MTKGRRLQPSRASLNALAVGGQAAIGGINQMVASSTEAERKLPLSPPLMKRVVSFRLMALRPLGVSLLLMLLPAPVSIVKFVLIRFLPS